ncbi:hypothetical protein [Niabella drilacis]|uniref:Lipoprotein n=1 Tax=Niabella drilacis (strain DSM 25811 / CCM 8410 / CCUG 62505 / LMG 26954 / E90) TaxID=1285928 RepID=A0A1G7BIL7_NIADE|nr:hypothetical protein [Niabella drilacis]SDE26762.1 hypothetical protein SAMN04487894_13011 [Niabella drilacis]
MKRALLILSVIYLSVIAIGCSKNYKSKKVIENKSTHNIKVTLYGSPPNRVERGTFLVASDKTQTIVDFNSTAGAIYGENSACVRSDIDSITVEVNGDENFIVVKDFMNDNSWIASKTSNSKGFAVECRAIITDADIVPKSD